MKYVSTPMPLRLEAKLSWASREMQLGGGHRGEYSDMLVEASGRCDWGLCCFIGGATAYRSMSVVWGQIYEQRLNLRRSWQQGHSTPYNTLFLAKSSAEDLSLSIFRLKSCMALGRSLLLRM